MATTSRKVSETPVEPGADEDGVFAKRKRSHYRRTQADSFIGFLVHFLLMCFNVYIGVYEAGVIKTLKARGEHIKAFPGIETYGSRWKYFTYINLWLQLVYFFLGFFVDIMPRSFVKIKLRDIQDALFSSLVFPASIFVAVTFWGLYGYNRDFIYPAELDKYIPQLLNHYWHTTIVVTVLIELLLVYHKYPSLMTSVSIIFVASTAYVIWIVNVFQQAKRWPYPFLGHLPPLGLAGFFFGCFLSVLGIYFIGKQIAKYRFGEIELYKEEESVAKKED